MNLNILLGMLVRKVQNNSNLAKMAKERIITQYDLILEKKAVKYN